MVGGGRWAPTGRRDRKSSRVLSVHRVTPQPIVIPSDNGFDAAHDIEKTLTPVGHSSAFHPNGTVSHFPNNFGQLCSGPMGYTIHQSVSHARRVRAWP